MLEEGALLLEWNLGLVGVRVLIELVQAVSKHAVGFDVGYVA